MSPRGGGIPRRAIATAFVLAAAAAPAAEPRPGSPDEVRGQLALRIAGALPLGDATEGVAIRDLASGALPVAIELGARGGATTVAFALEWGRALAARCPPGVGCSASVTRAGLEVLHHFSPRGSPASTWAGAGAGWEGLQVERAGRSVRLDSLELLRIRVGREVAVGRGSALGPFVGATLAQGMQVDGEDVERKSPHLWIELGLRWVLDR